MAGEITITETLHYDLRTGDVVSTMVTGLRAAHVIERIEDDPQCRLMEVRETSCSDVDEVFRRLLGYVMDDVLGSRAVG